MARLAKGTPQAKFDLTVYLQDRPAGLGVSLVYNTDLFTAERMQMLLQQVRGLLEQIVVAPDQPLSTYTLGTPADQHLLPDPSLPLETPRAGTGACPSGDMERDNPATPRRAPRPPHLELCGVNESGGDGQPGLARVGGQEGRGGRDRWFLQFWTGGQSSRRVT